MTTATSELPLPALPFIAHFTDTFSVLLADGALGLGGEVFSFGQELELTEELVALNTGRDGRCSLLDRLRAGSGIHLGPWPPDRSRLQPGSFEHADAYEAQRRQAWQISDEGERALALSRLREEFAPGPTSRTIQEVPPRV